MEIRKAEEKDSKRIVELLEYIFLLHFNNRKDLFEGFSKYDIKQVNELINHKDYYIIVAVEESYVIGYAISKKINARNNKVVLYIDDLCVDENYQHLGVGKELMNYVKEYAVENNYDRIELNVWEFNSRAYEFYKSLGYNTQRREMEIVLK